MSAQPLVLAQPWLRPQTVAEVWLPYAEALTLCDRTMQWLNGKIREGAVRVRTSDRMLRNGRPDRELLLSSLPADAQRRHAARQAKTAAPIQADLFGTQLALVNRSAPRIKIAPQHSSEAERKQAILEPILAMRHSYNRETYGRSLRLANGQPVDSQARMIQFQVEQQALAGNPITSRTLERWVAAHRAEGVNGLARRRRSDAGRSRFFDWPENRRAAALLAFLHLGDGMTPGLNIQACHDMLHIQCGLVGLDDDNLPHYATVRSFLNSMPEALKVFATRGRKEFGERMLPFLSRAYTEAANEIWISDHAIMDVEVMNDCIAGVPLGTPMRLRLTAIIDYRSRYVVGYSWAVEGSSDSITTAFRHAVEHAGPCEQWYCDNGKDYLKFIQGAIPGYLQLSASETSEWSEREMSAIERSGVLGRMGIRATRCLPHHPQSKHVERFFRTMHLTFCKAWQTYTGGKPSERPDQTSALMQVHRRAVRKGDLTASYHPFASEMMRSFDTWLARYHAKRGHRGRGMGYRSPAEVFHMERNPRQKPTPAPEELAVLCRAHTTARVNECEVRCNRHVYAPANATEARLMMELNRTDVAIAYDPLDAAFVFVLDGEGRVLTRLATKQLVRQAPDDPETQRQIAGMMQMRGQLVREKHDQHHNIIRAGKQLGVRTPLELLSATSFSQVDPTVPHSITPRKPEKHAPQSAAPAQPLQIEDAVARQLQRMAARSGGK